MSAVRFKRTLNTDGTVSVVDTLYKGHFTITLTRWNAVRSTFTTNERAAEFLYRKLWKEQYS